jgi:hypothetical protein
MIQDTTGTAKDLLSGLIQSGIPALAVIGQVEA